MNPTALDTLTPSMQPLPRLSVYRIADDLKRADFYREIRAAQNDPTWPEHNIEPSDAKNPERLAYRVYGTAEMKQVVMIACGLDDMRLELSVGTRVRLPSAVWVRERIRHYSGERTAVV